MRAEYPIGAMRPGIVKKTRQREKMRIAFRLSLEGSFIENGVPQVDISLIRREDIRQRTRHGAWAILLRLSAGLRIGAIDRPSR